jgi:phosphomannomutase / phosphoglucomutase
MARKPKVEAAERPKIPPQLRAALLGVFALVALFAGLYIVWQSWQAWRQTQIEPELMALRDRLATDVSSANAALRGRFTAAISDAYVLADLEAKANDDAIGRVRETWPELNIVEFHEPGLEVAFAGDLQSLGFSKLALLSAANTSNEAVSGLIGGGDATEIGFASPVKSGERSLAIAFASAPLALMTAPIEAADLPGGYLELRSGTRVVYSIGNASLRSASQTVPVANTGLQIGAAAPAPQTLLSYAPWVQALIGLVTIGLGAVLVARLRAAQGVASLPNEPELTFVEALQQARVEPVARPVAARPKPVASHVDRSIFRAYDIRGVLGSTLDEGVARLIGQAVGSLMRDKGLREIVVGRDGRLSGPSLSAALIEGLRRAGRDVVDIGLAPTPLVYFANFHLNTGSGIAVTGSHNPPDYNGFKIVVGGETLSGQAIQDLYTRIAEGQLSEEGGGALQVLDIAGDYLSRVAGDVQLERKLKVVVDAGNGVAGAIAPQVLEAIGAEVIPLHCEVDGEFPNHHPDPGDPHNLQDLITFVAKFNADLGIAFDGDGDRLGVVTRHGEIIYPDRLLMLFAQDVLSRNPGASVIYDVKCTGHLAGQILRHGGSPIMWKTGHSFIKAKMRETEAELAGEMSGHFFFKERWYGFDDGIYAAARLLEILAASDGTPEEVFAELPKGVSTPELKVVVREGEQYAFMEAFRERARFEGGKIATIDGIRVDWADGWGLVRSSNTTPSLVLRFDADSASALSRIQEVFRAQILAVDPGLELPF